MFPWQFQKVVNKPKKRKDAVSYKIIKAPNHSSLRYDCMLHAVHGMYGIRFTHRRMACVKAAFQLRVFHTCVHARKS